MAFDLLAYVDDRFYASASDYLEIIGVRQVRQGANLTHPATPRRSVVDRGGSIIIPTYEPTEVYDFATQLLVRRELVDPELVTTPLKAGLWLNFDQTNITYYQRQWIDNYISAIAADLQLQNRMSVVVCDFVATALDIAVLVAHLDGHREILPSRLY